jgi:hypothetical protein
LIPQIRSLEAEAISGIAHQPFLLVDFAFAKPKILRELLKAGPSPLRFPRPRGTFPEADAKALIRGALLLARNVCRHHPVHAGLLLGLDPSLQLFWRCLLSAPASTDPDAWHQLRMYGMQLIAGEMHTEIRGSR